MNILPTIMEIKFLGGADEVGSLAMLMRNEGVQLLFDYGITPSNPPRYPMNAPPVDNVLLSHAHVDHSGMIPWLCGRYDTKVLATPPTILVSEMLVEDALKIAKAEGFPEPYTNEDIMKTKENFRAVDFKDSRMFGDLEVIFHSAGHIPGASMFEIKGEKTTLFTGDINTISTRLIWGARPVECDNLIMESTYAGRDHPERLKMEYEFLQKIKEVVERGGTALVPSFAVGRTQEIMLTLLESKYEIWLDGMGKRVNKQYLKWPEYLRSPKKMRRAMGKVRVVHSERGRKHALKGDVIITTSGMLDGGPVLYYLDQLKDDDKSAIILTGYQVEGTNGRLLLNKGRIDFHGAIERM
jgi:putative mRNA 3-end processing factor